jgi:hypothetical protein
VPPSLVLILLGDAMLRAHTEASNVTGLSGRIINTQDVFHGAMVPAAAFLVLCAAITWWTGRRGTPAQPMPKTGRGDVVTAACATAFIVTLLGAVALGYLYAVEAAATGGVALVAYGLATRTLGRAGSSTRCATRSRSPGRSSRCRWRRLLHAGAARVRHRPLARRRLRPHGAGGAHPALAATLLALGPAHWSSTPSR